MSNYPNMSYCMFQNTMLAMDQIKDAMLDAEMDNELGQFFVGLSKDERWACFQLANRCRDFLELLEQAEEKLKKKRRS